MLTEQAQIIEIEKLRVKVAVKSANGCGSCSAKAGCGTGILDRWLNPTHIFWLDLSQDTKNKLQIGDLLEIGVDENAFVRNTLLLYLLPILIFFIAAGLGFAVGGEIVSILAGIAGLISGAVLANYLIQKSPYAQNFSPQILSSSTAPLGQVGLVSPKANPINNP